MSDQISIASLQAEVASLRAQLAECKRKGSEWYHRAVAAEKQVHEYQDILSNKNLSASQAVTLKRVLDIVDGSKPRDDGTCYVSRELVAEKLPISDQAAGDAMKVLSESGILPITKERKKHGVGFNLRVGPIPQQVRLNLAHVVVDSAAHPHAGGKRIPIHKVCGGLCREVTRYQCEKCGETDIRSNQVLMVDEETWNREQDGMEMETEQTYLENRKKREATQPPTVAVPVPQPLFVIPKQTLLSGHEESCDV